MSATTDRKGAPVSRNERVALLEVLVDELIKTNPDEKQIRVCFDSLHLPYIQDPVERMECVLAELDKIRNQRRERVSEL